MGRAFGAHAGAAQGEVDLGPPRVLPVHAPRMPCNAEGAAGEAPHSNQFAVIHAAARQVNRTVLQNSDVEHMGRRTCDTSPEDGVGDCEDFALDKRRALVQLCFPRSALLITKVTRANGEGMRS